MMGVSAKTDLCQFLKNEEAASLGKADPGNQVNFT